MDNIGRCPCDGIPLPQRIRVSSSNFLAGARFPRRKFIGARIEEIEISSRNSLLQENNAFMGPLQRITWRSIPLKMWQLSDLTMRRCPILKLGPSHMMEISFEFPPPWHLKWRRYVLSTGTPIILCEKINDIPRNYIARDIISPVLCRSLISYLFREWIWHLTEKIFSQI